MMLAEAGTRIVLPSPNGSTLSADTAGVAPTFAGCLRNAGAVAGALAATGRRIAVVPCGERWKVDDSLRPAVEDWLGAGAIIDRLPGRRSPEARAAAELFASTRDRLFETIVGSASGRELVQMGYRGDSEIACELDASATVPQLIDGAYVDVA
jgi:2-phosphosulfolactate phosphatase